MVEVDIDKMLAKTEEKEKKEKQKKAIVLYSAIAAAVVIAGAIAFIATGIVIGDKSESYFPLEPGRKMIYNQKGKSPEEWQIQEKSENVYGYECSVMNKIDKGNLLLKQEFYTVDDKQGIARLAYSENYGQKVKDVFKILPYRVKSGMSFDAGTIKGNVIKAVVLDKEIMSTPVGEIDAYRVEYKAPPYYDTTVWYAKGVGVVREINNRTAEEISLISAGE